MDRTAHATIRAQQRGVPPLIDHWLDEFGESEFDGHGGITLYFGSDSIRRLERHVGRAILRKLSEYLDAYKVVSTDSGTTITIGHRFRRVKRK